MARILIADDSKVIRRIYEKLLDYLGHEVISCRDGDEVLEKFAVEHVDLMILDVQMPEKNGIEVCRRIRQQPRGLYIPIIIVSSLQREDEILEGLNAGANDYLLKPLKESHLIARLKNLLKTATLQKSDYELVKNQVVFADRYKILKIIGYGRHSIVFMVEDQKADNRKKALKLLNQSINDPELLAKYLETAQRISKIDSEYITKTLDSGQYAERCYLIMEYMSGGDLRELLDHRELSYLEAVHLGNDISKAISDLGKHDIIHFDIKPENILVSEDNHFKLADFGMLTTRKSATVPMDMEIWSTVAYVSPEYINAEHPLSSKSDVYSLGTTIYEGLTGDNPFMADKPVNSLYRQINTHVPALIKRYANIPEELSDIVQLMLAKNPDLRPEAEECANIFSVLLDSNNYTWAEKDNQQSMVKHRMARDLSDKSASKISSTRTAEYIKKLAEIKEKSQKPQ